MRALRAVWVRLTRDPDRGSVSLWMVTGAFVMIVLVGVAVDLTGQVRAQQEAHAIAQQAARAGGQQIEASGGMRGTGAHANIALAVNSAQGHLANSGVSGGVTVEGGTRIVVTANDTYQTKFLSIIGIGGMPVTGSAEARIARAVDGGEQ